jgi:hypothetical protein
MKKRILCYTNFSKNSLNAIHYALKMNEHQSCIFYFLNAFQAGGNATDIAAMIPEPGEKQYEDSKKYSEDSLKELKATLRSLYKNPKHSYQTISSYNSLLYALKDTIAKNSIDLLVIGAKNVSHDDDDGDEEINILDIMEFISACPILAIPGGYKFSGLKKVLFPTNYEIPLNETTIAFMIEIVKLHGADITLLHIKKENELDVNQMENKNKLESALKGLKYHFYDLTNIRVTKGIHNFIESEAYDLIVFQDEESNYIGNKLPKPLIKELNANLLIPILLINYKI